MESDTFAEITENTATQHTYADEPTFPGSSHGHYTNQTADFTQQERSQHQRRQSHHSDHQMTHDSDIDLDDSLLESLNLTGGAMQSTPQHQPRHKWESIDSPFSALKAELNEGNTTMGENTTIQPPPTTPRRRPVQDSPDSSPMLPPPTISRTPAGLVLHRVLDKNWRIQATPIGKKTPSRFMSHAPTTPRQPFTPAGEAFSSSPISSPPEAKTQMLFSPAGPAATPESYKRWALAHIKAYLFVMVLYHTYLTIDEHSRTS